MATERPLESQVQDQLQYSLLNRNELRLVPYTRVDGEWTLPDGFLLEFVSRMAHEGSFQRVFYNGALKSTEDFLEFMQRPANVPVFFFDGSEPLGVAWVNGLDGALAFGHFAGLKKARGMTTEIGEMVLRYWMSWDLFWAIVGIIPSTNVLAVRFVKRIGFTVLGEIPGVLYDAYRGERVNAVVSYYAR